MDQTAFARAVRQPKSAAVAGLVFGVILSAVLILLQSAAPSSVAESGGWIDDLSERGEVVTALKLIPFAGIAFLWFLAVVRSQLGHPRRPILRDRVPRLRTALRGHVVLGSCGTRFSPLAPGCRGALAPGAASQAWLD